MKKIILYTLLFLFVGATQAQNQSSIDTFKGFHIGLTGHIELIKGSSYNNIYGTVLPPSREMTIGGQGNIEFSYNFAKYLPVGRIK